MLPGASDSTVGQFSRYSFAGVINTAIGYAVIFSGMALGFSPYVSNFAGYTVGLCCSFILNKHFVFLAKGNRRRQIGRFMAAFGIAYLLNLAFLHVCLEAGVAKVAAQILAGVLYLAAMYMLSRVWVFAK